MDFTLKVWRQASGKAPGGFKIYGAKEISPDASFLEMLDIVNAGLVRDGEEPIAFDHDCREGICGSCGLMINGRAHGPLRGVATCELRMRAFKSGGTIVVEPWRARAFPIIKDLVVDRTAMDRIDANSVLVAKELADEAFDAAACIGCGACVATCKNASAMLFVAAKVSHLALLPQGAPERARRVEAMLSQMDADGFGACSNTYACEAECPKEISVSHIARLNREYIRAKLG